MMTYQVINGNWVIDARTGRPKTISGSAKLSQDIDEMLTIATQPNGFGAGLDDALGRDVDPFGFQMEIQRRIQAATQTLQRLQDGRPAPERVAGVVSVNVNFAPNSKTDYVFVLRVRDATNASSTRTGIV